MKLLQTGQTSNNSTVELYEVDPGQLYIIRLTSPNGAVFSMVTSNLTNAEYAFALFTGSVQ